MTKQNKFEYGKGRDGLYYFHLKAKNGEIITQGEGYNNRKDCLAVLGLFFLLTPANTKVVRKDPKKLPKHYEGKIVLQ